MQGSETLGYVQACGEEQVAELRLSAELERDPSDPESVALGFWYMRVEMARHVQVSAYGGDGESALSDDAIEL